MNQNFQIPTVFETGSVCIIGVLIKGTTFCKDRLQMRVTVHLHVFLEYMVYVKSQGTQRSVHKCVGFILAWKSAAAVCALNIQSDRVQCTDDTPLAKE